MIGALPKRPTGSTPEAVFMAWVWDRMVAESLNQVAGNKVNRTTRGSFIIPQAGEGSGVSLIRVRLKSVEDDYLVCRDWDGTNEGATDIYVAKEFHARTSRASATVVGDTHTYTYAAGDDTLNKVRTVDDGTETEDQIIVPPWEVNEEFCAVSAATGVQTVPPEPEDGEEEESALPVDYLIVGRSATWARWDG